ncbi:cobalt transporter CbiM [Spirulina sp. CS-785/01]|uniref:cobalt transporter CbiM n=1 Tax=Spirulina sp. CS-785/01 TaxID=3021716 RepID=UPI00232C881B|nr:cobalt transporter CbiM [Spirulina sp. CS-785/01]MDB9314155.1 cobalt transporter CbiM [Spirulina sp. CS-785/01]
MHIPDGFLPPTVAIAGYAITGGATWFSVRQIRQDSDPTANIPKAALLTAAFFVASLIHIPIPPSSIHLVLNGLMGIILGYYAFPAILIGLFFQAVMFGHGGISSLGVNTAMMGIPALLAYYGFWWSQRGKRTPPLWRKISVFLAGGGALLLSAATFVIITITTIPPELNADLERNAIYASLIGYSIQALIEGSFTVMVIVFLERVKPEVLKVSEP